MASTSEGLRTKSLQGRDGGGGEGGKGRGTYGDSISGTTLLIPLTLTVRRADPGEDRFALQLSECAGDRVSLKPASGIEGGTGNQNQRAAAGPRWCVPCTLVVQVAPSLAEERLAESWIFEYGRRIGDGEHERARREWWVGRGSLLPIGASPGRYISTSTSRESGKGRFAWNLPWDAALSELWKGPGEEGGAGGHTRHAEGGCGRLASSVGPWRGGGGRRGGGNDNERAKGKRRASGAETMIKMAETSQCHEKPEPGRTQATLPSLSCVALRRWDRSPGHQTLSAAPFRLSLSPLVPEQDHRPQEPDHRPRERPGYTVAVIFS